MNNFIYSIPTKIYFGKRQIENLSKIITDYKKVLLVYGGGSIKRTGVYDEVLNELGDTTIIELSGIDPNPRIESVYEGVKLCRENDIDLVLAVGGGSVIDCAKFIAAGVKYDGDAWDLSKDPTKICGALPLVTVLTLAATGSEMNAGGVISNLKTNEKLGSGHPCMFPIASILDPEYTYTVSKKQTAAGTADIMSHIFENYFNHTDDAMIPNSFAESLLKTCIKYAPIAINDPSNYEARSNLMWAASLAINGLLKFGADDVYWSMHPVEHELSAFYDITHGEGLAILTPQWMKYACNDKTQAKFAQYGINVWQIDDKLSQKEIAKLAIDKTYKFFSDIGIPMSLKELGIDESKFEEMAEKAVGHSGVIHGFIDLDKNDVIEIYKMSY